MKRRVILITLFVVGAIVVGGWLLWPADKEPIYDGKPLTESMYGFLVYIRIAGPKLREGETPQEYLESQKAVRAVGTNAIPFFLRLIKSHDSPGKLKVVTLAQRQQHLVKIRFIPATDKREMAIHGFGTLGGSASNAVPTLIHIYEHASIPEVRRAAAEALGRIGSPSRGAVGSLLRNTTNTDLALSQSAIRTLGRIRSEPLLVIPVLTQLLTNSSDVIRGSALMALTDFSSDAKPAVPALFDLLKEAGRTSSIGTHFVVNAIRIIDPETAAARSAEIDAVLNATKGQ